MLQTEWVRIICMAVHLFHAAEGGGETSIRIQWNTPDVYGYIAPDSLKSASVELVSIDEKRTIKEFILFPWQDLYEPKISAESVISNQLKFLTVTPYALIFEKFSGTQDSAYVKNASEFDHAFFRIIGYDSCRHRIREEQGFTIPNGLQVIRLREYPHFVDLETALPGSKAVRPAIPEGITRGKMIRLSLIPDYGPVHTQWLFQPYEYDDSCIARTEKTALSHIASLFEESVRQSREYNRLALYDQCRFQIGNDVAAAGCEKNSVSKHWNRVVRQLLLVDDNEDAYHDIRRVFPDYEPKRTPDTMTDFMPGIIEDIETMPAAELQNLNELLKRFSDYEKHARKNPGKWVDGNMILGANEKEYRPSREELLLNECGMRIKTIVESADSAKRVSYVAENRIKTKKIKFRHFTFRHTDALGSGRFFYVNEIRDEKVRIIKQK